MSCFLQIDGKEIIVKGVGPHAPIREQSILWITNSREPLGLVDRILETNIRFYVIRYNNEDKIPSGVVKGTHVSFVLEFANMEDASDEWDEDLPDEEQLSYDENEVDTAQALVISASHNFQHPRVTDTHYSNTYQYSETGQYDFSSPVLGGYWIWPDETAFQWQPQPMLFTNVITADGIHQSIVPAGGSGGDWDWRNEMAFHQQQQLPMYFSNEFPTVPWMDQNSFIYAGGPDTSEVYQHISFPTSLYSRSNRVWPTEIETQYQQQAISNVFYDDGMMWMIQQSNLAQNPYNMLMPIQQPFVPSRMLLSTSLELEYQQPQQPMFSSNTFPTMPIIPEPTEPTLIYPNLGMPYFHSHVGQHVLVGRRISDIPSPWIFGEISSNQSREDRTVITRTPTSGVTLSSVPPFSSQYRAAQLLSIMPANTHRGDQVQPSEPPNTHLRGSSGEREGHLGRDDGSSS